MSHTVPWEALCLSCRAREASRHVKHELLSATWNHTILRVENDFWEWLYNYSLIHRWHRETRRMEATCWRSLNLCGQRVRVAGNRGCRGKDTGRRGQMCRAVFTMCPGQCGPQPGCLAGAQLRTARWQAVLLQRGFCHHIRITELLRMKSSVTFKCHCNLNVHRQKNGKEGVAHVPNGILRSHEKEWNSAICYDVDRPRDCPTEWSMKTTAYNITYVGNLEREYK